MKLKAITYEEYETLCKNSYHYKETKLFKFLNAFSKSSDTICEVLDWQDNYKNGDIAVTSIRNAVKRYGFAVAVKKRNNRVLLLKVSSDA